MENTSTTEKTKVQITQTGRNKIMDAFELLEKDHRQVKGLFKQYEGSGEKAYKKKQEIADQIFLELDVHAQIEEELFYPAVEESKAKEEVKKLVKEAYEEHHLVKVLIAELKELSSEDEAFEAKMKVLRENVEHHIEEEEGELFPDSKKNLNGEAEELGMQLKQRKEELLAEQE